MSRLRVTRDAGRSFQIPLTLDRADARLRDHARRGRGLRGQHRRRPLRRRGAGQCATEDSRSARFRRSTCSASPPARASSGRAPTTRAASPWASRAATEGRSRRGSGRAASRVRSRARRRRRDPSRATPTPARPVCRRCVRGPVRDPRRLRRRGRPGLASGTPRLALDASASPLAPDASASAVMRTSFSSCGCSAAPGDGSSEIGAVGALDGRRCAPQETHTRLVSSVRTREAHVPLHPRGATMRRVRRALPFAAAVASALLSSVPAAANGRFPASNQIVFSPNNDNLIVLRTSYGILPSHDNGATWAFVCEDALGLGPTAVEDPSVGLTTNNALIAGVSVGLERVARRRVQLELHPGRAPQPANRRHRGPARQPRQRRRHHADLPADRLGGRRTSIRRSSRPPTTA